MSVTETQTKTDSGVIVVPELATRYRLAESQLALLPPADEDDAEEWSGLRFQCEEVMELIERISRAEERERVLREALDKYEPIIIELAGRSKEAFSAIDGAMSRLIADAQNATDKRPVIDWAAIATHQIKCGCGYGPGEVCHVCNGTGIVLATAAPEQGKEAKS